MIVEMVAADIGEAADRDAAAAKPALVKPGRRGLDRQVGHAVASEFVERAMQRHRVGRGERAVVLALGRDEPDGADAGRGLSRRGPYLACERGDRGLAARPGDGGDAPGLFR